MLLKIKDLPAGVDGVEAKGTITRDDYENVLNPIIDEAHRNNRRLHFLYRFGPEFDTFTASAAWDDFQIGLKNTTLFERCSVVTDRDWIRNACQLMAPLFPYPIRVFKDSEMKSAIAWLASARQAHNIAPKLIPEKEVVVVEVSGPLGREDFELLSAEVDPWIEKHHSLRGIVVHAKKFPGWTWKVPLPKPPRNLHLPEFY